MEAPRQTRDTAVRALGAGCWEGGRAQGGAARRADPALLLPLRAGRAEQARRTGTPCLPGTGVAAGMEALGTADGDVATKLPEGGAPAAGERSVLQSVALLR